ncbi:PREDICTED: peptidoglycan recognition protein-like [Papilio xuthus]|uniref:Peptidoglycan-recognition protein n=1 Tax=Papilio xuthus TaxID=66420 RepID=A0AAJ6ZDQ8_PAPXU|nr:PREDICTED: peptidoglycan recognition protein-like [Papilio xuthus]
MTSLHLLLFVFVAKIVAATDRDCGVLPITLWSGEKSRRTSMLKTPVQLVVIQHTVSPACYTDQACESILRGIRIHHIVDLDFIDIGTSFLIGGNGRVYEGAGWQRIGAHTRGYNDKSISISFIGNFNNELPTSKALKAAQDLINCGVYNNYLTKDYELVGHRQLSATQSPGDSLQDLIETWPHWKKFD